MNRRQKAVEILTAAREALIERVCDFAINNQEELLGHADGSSYFCADELFDCGEQLRQYSLILGVMEEAMFEGCDIDDGPNTVAVAMAYEPITFKLWADQIRCGDLTGATYSLAQLFQIDLPVAAQCNQYFITKLNRDPQAFAKVLQIRDQLAAGSLNGSTMLLQECFGLQGHEAVHVASWLQRSL